jgi:hypothetical protein
VRIARLHDRGNIQLHDEQRPESADGMEAAVANPWLTTQIEQYKAMDRLHDEYRLQLLTAELVIDDPILKPLIGALVEHIGNLANATQPVWDAASGGGSAQNQLGALRA